LEERLNDMSEKYKDLEFEHHELQLAYDKLQQMLELLTSDDPGEKSGEKLRKFFEILHGKARRRVHASRDDK